MAEPYPARSTFQVAALPAGAASAELAGTEGFEAYFAALSPSRGAAGAATPSAAM